MNTEKLEKIRSDGASIQANATILLNSVRTNQEIFDGLMKTCTMSEDPREYHSDTRDSCLIMFNSRNFIDFWKKLHVEVNL